MGAIVLAQEGGAVAKRRLMGVALALAIAATLAGVLLRLRPELFLCPKSCQRPHPGIFARGHGDRPDLRDDRWRH